MLKSGRGGQISHRPQAMKSATRGVGMLGFFERCPGALEVPMPGLRRRRASSRGRAHHGTQHTLNGRLSMSLAALMAVALRGKRLWAHELVAAGLEQFQPIASSLAGHAEPFDDLCDRNHAVLLFQRNKTDGRHQQRARERVGLPLGVFVGFVLCLEAVERSLIRGRHLRQAQQLIGMQQVVTAGIS